MHGYILKSKNPANCIPTQLIKAIFRWVFLGKMRFKKPMYNDVVKNVKFVYVYQYC